jgi:hypothetical protein
VPRKVYSDGDRAAVWVALQANENNVAQTSRDTGVPEQTVREWRNAWKKDPPNFDAVMVEQVHSDFLTVAESTRDLLMVKYREAVERGEVKPDKFPLHIAILTDKVNLLRGLATSRSESTLALPSPEETRKLAENLVSAVRGAIDKAQEREQDIIEVVDYVEEQAPKALPSGS